MKFLNWIRRINRLFIVTVIVPTLVAAIYYGLIASDMYISESRFIVRGAQKPIQAGAFGQLLQSTGLSRSLDDQYAVHDFMLSRDALKGLDSTLNLSQKFRDPHIDFVDRFGSFGWNTSFEALLKYYRRRVLVELDAKSSISVLTVNAFTAQDARDINEKLLKMSEQLINEMSERSRKDIVSFSEGEVALAERKAKEAALAVATYRVEKKVLDPEKQSAFQLEQTSKLQEEIVATRAEVAQLQAVTPDNPQISALSTRITEYQKEIDAEMARIAGRGGSLTNKATGYMQVALEREFAEKQLAAAMTLLETARNEAQRQQLYLDRVVQPNLPDYPMEPRRLRYTLIVLVVGAVVWIIASLLGAAVREHLD
jgi:capsular polysaccharide transport system permease protein